MLEMEAPVTEINSSLSLSRIGATGPCLLVRIYPVQGIEAPLELGAQPISVGRCSESSLVLADDSVSRRHALLEPDGEGGHLVSDLGSTNGTYVNERRITEPVRLAAGDRVRFGKQIFKYLGPDRIEANYHEVIYKSMTTDGLTGAHTKRYLLETMERELEQSRRTGNLVCVLMLDLDRFKSINDTWGHLAGDLVLVEFARRIRTGLRGGDFLARYGGEEFAVLLSRTAPDEAMRIAERIREATAHEPVRFEEQSIPMTVSIGVASGTGATVASAEELLGQADERLYHAKRSGRNQVCE
jgi:diguanylate cyclase (GGDEF)-like protein